MKYTMYFGCAQELDRIDRLDIRRPWVRRLWRNVARVLNVVCFIGGYAASVGFLIGSFQLLVRSGTASQSRTIAQVFVWFTSLILGAVGVRFLTLLKRRLISFDAICLFAGVATALWWIRMSAR